MTIQNLLKITFVIVLLTSQIKLHGQIPDFHYTQDDPCSSNISFFIDSTQYAKETTFYWHFGDHSKAKKGAQVMHYYECYGDGTQSYTVNLKINTVDGKLLEIVKNISVNQIPDARFTDRNIHAPFASCDGAVVSTLHLRAPPVHINGAIYSIDFGDGSSYKGDRFPNNLSHQYSKEGKYPVTLMITSPGGCTVSQKEYYFLGRNPGIPSFEMKPLPPTVCGPYRVVFYVHGAKDNSPGTSYEVIFSDGSEPLRFEHPVPDSIVHTFYNTSCGHQTPSGFKDAFYAKITAYNNCGVASGTVEPIRISTPPVAQIEVRRPREGACTNMIYQLCDQSDSNIFINSRGSCINNVSREWTLPDRDDCILEKGSLTDKCIWVKLISNRSYPFKLGVTSACGYSETQRFVTPVPLPEASFEWQLDTAISCKKRLQLKLNSKHVRWVKWQVKSESKWAFAEPYHDRSLNPEILLLEPGNFKIILMFSNDCRTITDSKSFHFEVSKTVLFPKDTVACIDAEAFLIPSQQTLFFQGKGIDSTGWFEPKISGPGIHPIQVIYQKDDECELIDTFNITVWSLPEVDTPDTISVCNNTQEINLNHYIKTTNASISHIEWSGPYISKQGALTIPDSTVIFNIQFQTYFLSGCIVSKDIFIFISDPVEVTVGDNQIICANIPFFNATASHLGGRWEAISRNAPPIEAKTGVIQGIKKGSYTYRYTLYKGSNCEVSDDVVFNFIAIETPELPTDLLACETETLLPLPNPDRLLIEWQSEHVSSEREIRTLQLEDLTPGIHHIPFVLRDTQAGCQMKGEIKLTIIPLPPTGFEIDDNICVNDKLLINNLVSNKNITWWKIKEFNLAPIQTDSPTFSFEKEGIYTIHQKVFYNTGGPIDQICSAEMSRIVTVSAPPSLNHLVLDIQPKKRKQISVKPSSLGMGNNTEVIVNKIKSGKYNIHAKVGNGCDALEVDFNIEVDKCPGCHKSKKIKKKRKTSLLSFRERTGRSRFGYKQSGCYF